ncbi:hypothetical protein P3L10_027799 [Capsicum annuum]
MCLDSYLWHSLFLSSATSTIRLKLWLLSMELIGAENHNINNVDVDLDSMIITDVIRKQNTGNMTLNKIIYYILRRFKDKDIQVQHCYMEANQVKMRAVIAQMDLGNALLRFDKILSLWTNKEK